MDPNAPKNRLQYERSPYLVQHSQNPVDWYPWSEEAFEKAKKEDKLIFLSVGYSACHWCHVMEHESFEDKEVAAVLAKYYVSIKVDREERPDIDQIYQLAYQVLHQRGGGWPLSMFLTPDKKPFFGGTYFPPERRYGMPSFREVLHSLQDAFVNRSKDVREQAEELAEALQKISKPPIRQLEEVGPELLGEAATQILQRADPLYGGTKGAPKFPNTMMLDIIATSAARGNKDSQRHIERTLDKMHRGGMYDHLGGGFARYSVDEKWLVPHFEKMLYDNAQLAKLYLDGWKLLNSKAPGDGPITKERCQQVVSEVLTYTSREMTSTEGTFYSAQDADSEGEEGKFFAWTPKQIADVVGFSDAEIACALFDVTDAGTFEHGKSVIAFPRTIPEVAQLLQKTEADVLGGYLRCREKLFAARELRVKPFRDEKCLASWNGLMISAFAEAGLVFQHDQWRKMAQTALKTWQTLAWRNGRLLHAIKDAEPYGTAFLDDYAGLAVAALDVFEALGDDSALTFAKQLVDAALDLFWDEPGGDFYYTPKDAEIVLYRPKDPHDHAYPGGVGLISNALIRLFDLTSEERYRTHAARVLSVLASTIKQNPMGLSTLVRALDYAARGPVEVIIAGDPTHPLTKTMRQTAASVYLPHRVLVVANNQEEAKRRGITSALFVERHAQADGAPNVYVCRNQTCEPPVTTQEALLALLAPYRTQG
jgi:uncharacterized protein